MRIILICFLFFSANQVLGCDGVGEASFYETLNRLVNDYESISNNAGTLLVKYDGNVFVRSQGYANISTNTENSIFTSFLIGSVGKQFTAAAIMKLVDQGLLTVDTEVTAVLNELDPAKWTVDGTSATVHHLLTHTAGTPDAYQVPAIMEKLYQETITIDDFLNAILDLEVRFKPGSQFDYSNTGYILLGEIVRRVSGKSFKSFMTENFFIPQLLFSTQVGPVYPSPFVAQPQIVKDGEIVSYLEEYNIIERHDDDTFTDGNIYTNVLDLERWVDLLVDGRLLSNESTVKMFTPSLNNYGYGWFIKDNADGSMTYQHSGGWIGYVSLAIHITEWDFTLVWLLNQFNDPTPSYLLVQNIISEIICSESNECDYL